MLDVSGASSLSGGAPRSSLNGDVSGASVVDLMGSATSMRLVASGGSHLELASLTVRDADLELSGGSHAQSRSPARWTPTRAAARGSSTPATRSSARWTSPVGRRSDRPRTRRPRAEPGAPSIATVTTVLPRGQVTLLACRRRGSLRGPPSPSDARRVVRRSRVWETAPIRSVPSHRLKPPRLPPPTHLRDPPRMGCRTPDTGPSANPGAPD